MFAARANRKKLAAPAKAPALRAADGRLTGQKVAWLWENPWKILAENSRFLEMSGTYEKVRTFFKGD